MGAPIENANDLAKQTKIAYGCLGGGSTYGFFKVCRRRRRRRLYLFIYSDIGQGADRQSCRFPDTLGVLDVFSFIRRSALDVSQDRRQTSIPMSPPKKVDGSSEEGSCNFFHTLDSHPQRRSVVFRNPTAWSGLSSLWHWPLEYNEALEDESCNFLQLRESLGGSENFH